MTTQFEFRLIGASAPAGELEADQLLAIVASLKEIATKIGRVETDAERVGRTAKRTQRVAKLTIGLAAGSTSVLARRTGTTDALDLDLADEQAFDERFAALMESIALDHRPTWVDDSLSLAAGELTAALQTSARELEFKVAGQVRSRFRADEIHRETWQIASIQSPDSITFAGRLYAANLNTHRLQVQDDVGNRVALPGVANDTEASKLIGTYVTVTGAPEVDATGRPISIRDAAVAPAPNPWGGAVVPDAVPLDEILRSAPGPDPDGGIELTDEEFASFLEAARG